MKILSTLECKKDTIPSYFFFFSRNFEGKIIILNTKAETKASHSLKIGNLRKWNHTTGAEDNIGAFIKKGNHIVYILYCIAHAYK